VRALFIQSASSQLWLGGRTLDAGLHGAGGARGGEHGAAGEGRRRRLAAVLQVRQPAAQHEALVRRQAPAAAAVARQECQTVHGIFCFQVRQPAAQHEAQV